MLFAEALRIFAPKLFGLVHRTPHQATGSHLRAVHIKGAEILHRGVQTLGEKFDVFNLKNKKIENLSNFFFNKIDQVRVVEFLRIHQFKRLQRFALDHLQGGIPSLLPAFNFLQQVAEGGQNDADHFLLGAFGQNVAKCLDDFMLFGDELCNVDVKGKAPLTFQKKYQFCMNIEIFCCVLTIDKK